MGLYSRETWEIYPWFDRVAKQNAKPQNYRESEVIYHLEVLPKFKESAIVAKNKNPNKRGYFAKWSGITCRNSYTHKKA